MTAEGSKWKLWTYTVKYIKLRAFNGAHFKNGSSFCQTSFHYLTWPPWLLKIDLRWSKIIAFLPYWYAYQTIGFKRWSEQKWYLFEEKLFYLIITSEEVKMKTWKIYWYLYQITVFQWCSFQKWSHFCTKIFDLTMTSMRAQNLPQMVKTDAFYTY